MKILSLPVLVCSLGYFVDVFDLFLFGIVRQQSLLDLGYEGTKNMQEGMNLLSLQMAGLLIGGFFWGILADKKGRTRALFLSILIYSAANIANGMVHSVFSYQVARFIAGFGLAGELGVAITLVSELIPKEKRGYATTWVASLGLAGAMLASICAKVLSWRACFILGGGLGLFLLLLRVSVGESPIFEKASKKVHATALQTLKLLAVKKNLKKYLALIAVGVPIWLVSGLIITFCPEIAGQVGFNLVVSPPDVFLYCYSGVVIGDVACGLISQKIRSRKKVLLGSIVSLFLLIVVFLNSGGGSALLFYCLLFTIGLATGYWSVLIAFAAEQFGTNLRATVTTTVPNLVRASVIPILAIFNVLKGNLPVQSSVLVLSTAISVLALAGLTLLPETFAKDLDFLE